MVTSIPLSILTSLAIPSAIGQTLNVMTLGGLALAVGILVDDATVEIENIHRNLGLGKRLVRAILDGAQQIAETEQVSADVEATIRRLIPKDEIQLVIDNIGQPQPINLGFTDSVTIGPSDGEILVSLNPERHQPTARWTKTLRETLPREFPGVTFFFQPADIVSQILNFGRPAPIDVQVAGYDQQATHEIALEVAARMARIPGAADVHLHQVVNTPSLLVNVDRSRAAEPS